MDEPIRALSWSQTADGRPLGRIVTIPTRMSPRDYELNIRVISPRLLGELLRAPEDVVILEQPNLATLYALLSKLVRRRKVVTLIEGDYKHLGKTGTTPPKVAFRWLLAHFVDLLITNSEDAEAYVKRTLRMPSHKVVVGWWLAGLPPTVAAEPPPKELLEGCEGPLFLTACQLIPRKGVDLLIDAIALYRKREGPCTLWIVGEGPEHDRLVERSKELGVEQAVHFLGHRDHARFKGLLEACDAFVFPSLRDFVGRVVAEALSVGVPVVASRLTGAADVLVIDGANGVTVDPRHTEGFVDGLRRTVEPQMIRRLREGAQITRPELLPEAAARVLCGAASRVREDAKPRAGIP